MIMNMLLILLALQPVTALARNLDKVSQKSDARSADKANVVFILADDLSMNLVPLMPNVNSMMKEGITFSNYFVTDSLCCPSRTSIMTGQFPHNTGVFTNEIPDGGYHVYKQRENDKQIYAVNMSEDGYQTAMLGKYLNAYEPKKNPPEQGWTHWVVGGNGYGNFNYDLNEDNKIVHYDNQPNEFLTDVIAGKADAFIRKNKSQPFIIELATFSPHAPYTAAPRHAELYKDLVMPKGPRFTKHAADAPQWLERIPDPTPAEQKNYEFVYQKRARAVQAIDEMIGKLRATIAELGLTNKTYFVFSSDNGYHLGEHGMTIGKQTAFDTDIHVPLIVVGPGVPAGRVSDEIVANIDLCPTFSAMGRSACINPDGVNLLPMIHGGAEVRHRDLILVEHSNMKYINSDEPDAEDPKHFPPSYEAIRSKGFLYVTYATGEFEYYDLAKDPFELKNVYPSLPADKKAKLAAAVSRIKTCKGTDECVAAQVWVE